MIAALLRAIGSAASRLGTAAKAEPAAARAGASVLRQNVPAKVLKPNKLLKSPSMKVAPSAGRGVLKRIASGVAGRGKTGSRALGVPAGPTQPERINVPSRPAPDGERYDGNRIAPDTYATDNSPDEKKKNTEDLAVKEKVPEQPDNTSETLAKLYIASQALQGAMSSFVPKIAYSGAVSAVGFSSPVGNKTPISTVLHYCLAVVFGMTQRALSSNIGLKVNLYYNENRVEVVYVQSSNALFDASNAAATTVIQNAPAAFGFGLGVAGFIWRQISTTDPAGDPKVTGDVSEFSKIPDVPGAVPAILQPIVNLNRAIGPGHIWDMAHESIFAGTPPLSMFIPGVQPYTDIVNWSRNGADRNPTDLSRPLLTMRPAANPSHPPVDRMGMDDTHFDLQSLVAQALYDPGVLPPKPDTYVALKNATL